MKKAALLFGSCLAVDLVIHLFLNTRVMTERAYLLALSADIPEGNTETLADALRTWNRLSYAMSPVVLVFRVGVAAFVVQLALMTLGVRWRLEAIVVAALWAQVPLLLERSVRALWLSVLPPPARLSATTGFAAPPWSISSLLGRVADPDGPGNVGVVLGKIGIFDAAWCLVFVSALRDPPGLRGHVASIAVLGTAILFAAIRWAGWLYLTRVEGLSPTL